MNASVSQDRTAPEIVAPVPISQPALGNANGTSLEQQAGLISNGANQVSDVWHVQDEL